MREELQVVGRRLRDRHISSKEAADALREFSGSNSAVDTDTAAWSLVLAGHRALEAVQLAASAGTAEATTRSLCEELHQAWSTAMAALQSLKNRGLESVVDAWGRGKCRPGVVFLGEGWPDVKGMPLDSWGCTLLACALDVAASVLDTDKAGQGSSIASSHTVADNIANDNFLEELVCLMSDVGTPLLSSRGYLGPSRFVAPLDGLHRRLGKRPKLLRGKGSEGSLGRRGESKVGDSCDSSMMPEATHTCSVCGCRFVSRNQLFKHLRTCLKHDDTDVATKSVDMNPKKPERKVQSKKKDPTKTRKGPQLSPSSVMLWFGDIPFELATSRQVGEMLWNTKPRGMPTPYVKYCTRKGYRQRLSTFATCTHGGSDDFSSGVETSGTKSGEKSKRPWMGYALVVFRDRVEADEASVHFNGLEVNGWVMRVQPHQPTKGNVSSTVNTNQLREDPPLGHCLLPPSLRPRERAAVLRRHCAITGVVPPGEGETDHRTMDGIKAYYRARPRSLRRVKGCAVPPHLLARLRTQLDTTRWPSIHGRPGVRSEHYLVLHLGKGGTNEGCYEQLAGLCRELLQWADPEYACTMVAVTKDFAGSPHIDYNDVTFQYAVSLGDFGVQNEGDAAGELCVEDSTRPDSVWVVETKDRIAKVDGRFIHWVRGYAGCPRYSLIFFCTDPAHATEPTDSVFPDFVPAGSQTSPSQ